MQEEVSAIIRTTGEENKLEPFHYTLQSLKEQSYKYFKIIIVTYKNADLIEGILRDLFPRHRYKVVALRVRNRCIQTNVGIKLADGEYVAILDDDMVLNSRWLENMIKVLKHSPPEVACLVSPVYPLYKAEGKISDSSRLPSFLPMIRKFMRTISPLHIFWLKNTRSLSRGLKEIPTIPSNCMVCKRKALLGAGLYDTSLREPLRGDDYDLGFKLRRHGYKILSYNIVEAFHAENYLIKWRGKDINYFMNMSLTEFYTLTKHRDFIGLHIILLHVLYRFIESLYWSYSNRKPLLPFSVLEGSIKGIIQGLKAKQ